MDVIDTIDTLFDEVSQEILEYRDSPEKLVDILKKFKRTMQYISLCNPTNDLYLLQSLTPIDTPIEI